MIRFGTIYVLFLEISTRMLGCLGGRVGSNESYEWFSYISTGSVCFIDTTLRALILLLYVQFDLSIIYIMNLWAPLLLMYQSGNSVPPLVAKGSEGAPWRGYAVLTYKGTETALKCTPRVNQNGRVWPALHLEMRIGEKWVKAKLILQLRCDNCLMTIDNKIAALRWVFFFANT